MPTSKPKIPPPLIALLTATLMYLLARATPRLSFPLPHPRLLATCTFLLGLLIALSAVTSFRRARTTLNPLHPDRASSLVTTGIFRHTRNPMYLGLLLALLACAFYLSNAAAFLLLPAFVLYITRFQIRPEEHALSSAFPEAFQSYKSSTRRWL